MVKQHKKRFQFLSFDFQGESTNFISPKVKNNLRLNIIECQDTKVQQKTRYSYKKSEMKLVPMYLPIYAPPKCISPLHGKQNKQPTMLKNTNSTKQTAKCMQIL